MTRPPRVLEVLLRLLLPPHERAEVLGDLAEQYRQRRRGRGRRVRAALWYLRQVLAVPGWFWLSRLRALDSTSLEIRPVLRRLARSPGFVLVAVLSMGLGIGANTAIFSVVRLLLFTPLAVESPQELSFVYHSRPEDFSGGRNYNSGQSVDPDTGTPIHTSLTYPAFEALRSATPAPYRLAGFTFLRQVALVDGEGPARSLNGVMVSGEYFPTLGLGMSVGRPLIPDDDRAEAPLVAVLSHALWTTAFGRDPAVVGRTVSLNGHDAEVVGVSAPGFAGLSPGGFFPPTDITVPLSAQPLLAPRMTPPEGSIFTSRDHFWVRLLARTPHGVATAPFEDALTAALRSSFESRPGTDADAAGQVGAHLLPGSRGLDGVRSDTEGPLRILVGVVGIVLLIACANIAGLLLARGTARGHEFAVRRAIGAPRGRLALPMLLEAAVVALAGGALGVFLAIWGGSFVTDALTAGMGAAVDFRVDREVLLLTTAVSLVAALLSGVLPAVHAARVEPRQEFGARGGTAGASRLAKALIVAQVAISVPLIIGAGLLTRTVAGLTRIDPGFATEDLTLFSVDAQSVAPDRDDATRMLGQVLDNVRDLPGVRSATLIENVLLSGWISNTAVEVDGERVSMHMNAVGPDFFETMGMEIVAGRALDDRDGADAPRVVVVNEAAAQEVFGGRAVGRTFQRGGEGVRVVGVVRDSRYSSLRAEVVPTFFDPYTQRGSGRMHVAFRSSESGLRMETALRQAVARAHPGLPITGLRTQAQQIDTALAGERLFAVLLTSFGALALLLACIGIHGITAFSVARRRSEMGVRIALGAHPQGVLGMVLRQVVRLAVAGLVLGLLLSLWAGPVLEAMLYGLEPTDPLTFVAAGGALLVVALLAGWLPARRAARTDPMRVLFTE